ncbi:retrovirus-related pol polyprotein from transposon TNT 1-94 [Tanacetum coccineum]
MQEKWCSGTQILLSSTVDHYKSKTEEVTLLKKDFKQKEDKFLEEFLDIKKLKDKIEDRLYKQDQSVQTVHMLCQPKSFYDEKHKVAIGYKNPLCLTRAKQVQPALYNGHVLVMSNHARPVVHDSEDTREISEITRKRMLEKMKSPLYDNNRKKAETLAPKPISALTVYPPNTPVKLVPRILPTKSQVKINLYVLTQLFTEFDKTCKTRITPSGITEGERGFEQTKRCYLTEVIPFFKTLKEHFVGVQTALFKEVKEMKEIFDQMNNEVDKNTVDKQCAEIEKKNLLIENENLIVNCLSTQLLYDVEKSRCLDLEADMSKVHDESKLISKLEREYLNLQLKYQHLQESFDNNKSHTVQEAPDFNSFFKIKNLEHQIQEKDNVIRHLKDLVANVNDRSREPYNAIDVTALIEQNDCDRVELEKVKQHYKELYDSIKITRAHTSEKTSTMLNEIESLKAQLRSKESCFTSDYVKPKVLAPGMYAIDVKPIPHPLKNNRSAHLNYISHLKESVETVREIVEEARVVKPLDNALNYACRYTKLSQELLEYVIGTCPKRFNERDNKAPSTPVTRKKQVTFSDKPGTSSSNTQKHKVHQRVQQTNIPVIPSTGVNDSTEASGSKPRSNTKKNRILPAKSENKKKVEDHPRTNKSVWTKVNRVDSSISSKRVVINSNSESVCKTCNKCLNSANHEMCVVNILSSVNATPTVKIVLNKGKQIWKPKGKLSDNSLNKTKRVWKATGKLFADIGYQWRPTGKKFTLGKLNCGYQWRPTGKKFALGELCPLTRLPVTCCSKHMTGNRSKLKNFVEKFIGSVRFGNDHFGAIMGYGDYVIGDSVISRVYYVEGLGHNLFSVGQFCDSDLEVAFRKHSCFVRDINGADLLKGSRRTNLYTISIDDMMKSSPICLLSKASKSKSWLWHRRLNHLNFGTINDLARKDLVRGLPRLKFEKDHLCSACQLGKSKKFSHKPKSENTNMEVLHTLHMDLCGPMRVQSINGKKYILVIVDDYSRFTWVKFLRSKDETPEFVINFLKQIQVLAYFIKNLFQELLNKTALSKDEITMAPVRMSSRPEPSIMTPGQLKSGLAPTDKELEMLFQPMFDEYLEQSRVNEPVPSATAVNAQVVPPGTSLSTTIAQDAPSTSASSSTSDMHHPVRHQGIAEEPTLEDSPITHDVLHPSFNPVTGEPGSAQSSSGNVNSAEPNQVNQPPDHLRRWTKDHPLDNIVGNPSRPVSTRKQLASDALCRIYKPKDIINDINLEYNIDITYKKAWGGRNKALQINSGCPIESFSELPLYFHNLKMANEGTVTHIETDDEGRFKMCFVAFGFAIRSFLTHMRPLLITDGAHLKGIYKGTNLVLVGMDGNNQIIPIAIGVTQGETGESWTWFFSKLRECIGEVPNLAIITDRHPTIIQSCNTVFPNAFHGYCCRHLMMNCKMKSEKLQAIYWKTCKAYTPEEFQRRITYLRSFRPEAYKKLEDAGFETWSRAMCPANRYNYMTSNSAESINNLTRHVRKAPVTKLMEWYRALLQKWYCDRREKYKGIPCGHVIAVARVMGCTDCSELALGWFRKTTLYSTYQELVYPLGESSTRHCPDGLQVVKPPKMDFPKPGRPKKTDRIKSQGEEPIQNTMAEQNVPTQPPTRTDEQIVPRSQWLIIRKSNLLFNAQKIQKNPIFQISVDILSNTKSVVTPQKWVAAENIRDRYLHKYNSTRINEDFIDKFSLLRADPRL